MEARTRITVIGEASDEWDVGGQTWKRYSGAVSLGTMEAEQQHVYGARMDSVPCGWSERGADAMARVRSRRASLAA